MQGIIQGSSNGFQEQRYQYEENQRDKADGKSGGRKSLVGVDVFLVGKTEESGFHTKRKKDKEQGCVGVQVGDNAVSPGFGRHPMGVDGHQQVVQEPTDNAAQAINGGLFRQGA